MAGSGAWPPLSPHAALLSSPSGRRKFREDPTVLDYSPPRKRQRTVKSDVSDDDEDEETLKLKLAAIEAKLKLKKLQGKQHPKSARKDQIQSSNTSVRLAASGRPPVVEEIEVPLSPSRRVALKNETRSPGRVLLGIDKGIRGGDISLRRARTVNGSPPKLTTQRVGLDARPASRISLHGSGRSLALEPSSHVKSFSERMAEVRDHDRLKEASKSNIRSSRAPGFKLDEGEIEDYQRAAEDSSKKAHIQPSSIRRQPVEFTREEVLLDSHATSSIANKLKRNRSSPGLRRSPTKSAPDTPSHELDIIAKGDPSLYEPFSQLHLSTRILPHSFLKRTLPDESYTRLRVPELLKQVTSPAYELPDSIVDYVVFGVLASKSSPYDHKPVPGQARSTSETDWERKWETGAQNQKRFMVFQVTDLKWSIDLYLFGTAVPRYHRLSPGTVVALLNPGIMPPKKGKEDTGAFSLTLNSDEDSVLEIGRARDLGFCNAVKKDGKECGSWVDASKTEICEFHLNAQVSKARAGRMGVNAGHNGFGGTRPGSSHRAGFANTQGPGKGLLPREEGRRYDRASGTQYFIANPSTNNNNITRTGPPPYRGEVGSARMLDLADDDDPFIAEGRLSRDKDSRLRKHLVAQEKERDIAKRLGALGSGGAGAEYLRSARRSEQKASGGTETGAVSTQRSIMIDQHQHSKPGGLLNASGKRAAESVRLSPVKRKKTRFLLVEKGIREAGRESLGTTIRQEQLENEDDDDDDEGGLDIV